MTQERNEPALESWKEIAAYLKRDVTTVRRWEKTEGLPVYRHLHESRASVYAYRSELDAWLASRTPAQRTQETAPPRRGAVRLAALAAALLMAAAASGDGLARPFETPAEAQGLTARQLWTGSSVDTTGAIVPGTAQLSFVDWETGDLAVRDLATGIARRVTNKGTWAESGEFALFSAPSPDGRFIAYAWLKESAWELRLAATDGGQPRVLYSHPDVLYLQPSGWSPDGQHVLVVFTRRDNTNQIALVSAADGSARILKALDWRFPISPRFSPDGRFVTYDFPASDNGAERDIFLISADGSREVPLVRHPANDYLPIWSPDGTRVVFLSDRAGAIGLWTIRMADGVAQGSAEPLKNDIGRVSSMEFDRRGSLYYGLETGMTDVYVAGLDLSAGIVTDPPAPVSQRFVGANSAADWSPDGTELAYMSLRLPGPSAARNPSLVVRSLETGIEREVATELIRARRARWSPDGQQLLIYALNAKGERGMFGVNPKTGEARLLIPLEPASYVALPAWSADGKAVFYTYASGNELALRMRRLDGSAEQILFRSNAQNLAPSPDGTSIAFTYATGTENRLVVLPLDGGEPRHITSAHQPEMIALDSVSWTRDGTHLLFAKGAGDTHTVWRVPASGGDPSKLNLTMEGLNVSLRLHPDGRRVAFTSGERTSEVWVLENLLPGAK